MPTECSAEQFDFGTVEGRAVEAAFDAGLVTSTARPTPRGSPSEMTGRVPTSCARSHDY